MSDGDIGQLPACGMCGRPVHPNSMGIRYRGGVQCHGESTCISVLEAEIDQLKQVVLSAQNAAVDLAKQLERAEGARDFLRLDNNALLQQRNNAIDERDAAFALLHEAREMLDNPETMDDDCEHLSLSRADSLIARIIYVIGGGD